MSEAIENAIEFYTGSDIVTVTFTQTKFKNKIISLAKKYPDEVDIVTNDGVYVCAHIPLKYLKITRPAGRTLTDEQKKATKERLTNARRRKKENG